MIGRGTRLRRDLFGPGKDEAFFFVFDYCGNLEFFSQDPATSDGALGESLGKKLFTARLEVIGELDRREAPAPGAAKGRGRATLPQAKEPEARYDASKTDKDIRGELAAHLQEQVAAMNLNNFIVRPKRRVVEKYARQEAWQKLGDEDHLVLAREVAGLLSELPEEDEEAKRFDLLMLRVELAMLRSEPGFERLRDQVRMIAGLLQEKASIPMVQKEMELILDVQTDEWWQDVTLPMLEAARKRLRALVKLIEKAQRQPVYTDFEDLIGAGKEIELPGFGSATDFDRFRAKARQFLRAHEDHMAIQKLRMARPLTASDLGELERMLLDEGVGTAEEIEQARQESAGLGLFIRSLVGLDRTAAMEAFARFLSDKTATANQIELVQLIIEHLTERGVMAPELLYESPFTDVSPRGPEGVFTDRQVEELVSVLEDLRRRAAG